MQSGWLLREGEVVCAVEIADGPGERGALRGRSGWDGALHLDGVRTVHTAGMRFPIDVAFLAEDLTVVRVARLKPWRIASGGRRAHGAVEAEAGALARWGVGVGDRLEVRLANGTGAQSDTPHGRADDRS